MPQRFYLPCPPIKVLQVDQRQYDVCRCGECVREYREGCFDCDGEERRGARCIEVNLRWAMLSWDPAYLRQQVHGQLAGGVLRGYKVCMRVSLDRWHGAQVHEVGGREAQVQRQRLRLHDGQSGLAGCGVHRSHEHSVSR